METIKISLNKPVYGTIDIPVYCFYETEENLNIVVADDSYTGLTVDQEVSLQRKANRGGYIHLVTEKFLIKEMQSRTIVLDKPSINKLRLVSYSEFLDTEGEQKGLILQFDKPHNVFLQDITTNKPKIWLEAFDVDGKRLWKKDNISIYKEPYGVAQTVDLFSYEEGEGCDTGMVDVTYTYLPESFLLDTVMLSGETETSLKCDKIDYMKFVIESDSKIREYNPYYYMIGDYKYPNADIKEKRLECAFWVDKLHGDNKVASVVKKASYWNVPVGLEKDIDWRMMDMADDNLFALADRAAASSVPDVINMERVQCVPSTNTRGSIATALTLNFHFRKRVEKEVLSSGDIVYDDGWHIDEESWWNGMEGDDVGGFMTASGRVSDMLGYIGFDDNDVFYRKSALSKSFVRLSFYNTNEVMSHSLMTYNTVYFSVGDIHGALLKQMRERNEGSITATTSAVFTDVPESSGRLDTRLTITSEMDTTKSAEGFNVYLFKSDVPQNSTTTIYMKVEFNHAKFGKTIPFLALGNGQKVTVDNYLSALYIPVQIRYINDRYTYYFPTANNNTAEKSITINLYEPRITDGD